MLQRAALVAAGLALLGAGPPGGVMAADTIEVTTYGPDGPVTRDVPLAQVDAWLERAGEPRLHPQCLPGVWCGPDIGYADDAGGPFCDTASAWVAHSGEPGAAYTALVPGPGPPQLVCGGFLGVAYDWDLVELSPLAVLTQLSYEGCYGGHWTIHTSGYCPNPFTPADTFIAHWRFRGLGVAVSFGSLDYFLAVEGTMCYDMPPGAFLQGAVLCP